MISSIESKLLRVSIRQQGIELSSIKNKKTGTEYMWQGNPEYWSGQAPVLFPIIGSLKNGSTHINGADYRIPKHGIIRHSKKPKIIQKAADSITYQVRWDKESLAVYPFKFEFEVAFQLKEKQLTIAHTIRNLGSEELPYNVGGHPAFNCPVHDNEQYFDYSIQFQHPEYLDSWLLDNLGLVTDQSVNMLKNSSSLRLNPTLFDNDALIFRSIKSHHATLRSDISGDILRVDFHEFPYLGIWAKPGAPFVCIEPWHGITDHISSGSKFLQKEKLRILEPNSEETLRYQITILE